MAKKFLKKWLPDPEWVKAHPSLSFFGELLHDPNLWHLTRRSASVAFMIGLSIAFVPLPSQMILATLCAIAFRANLPLSVCLVWVTNPVTMPVVFYLAYKVGALLLGVRVESFNFELSWDWVMHDLLPLWQPLLLGCLVCGLFTGLLGSFLVNTLWRTYVIRRWRKRRKEREQRALASKQNSDI